MRDIERFNNERIRHEAWVLMKLDLKIFSVCLLVVGIAYEAIKWLSNFMSN
jgi:hypothetical protein